MVNILLLQNFEKLTKEIFDLRLKRENFACQIDIVSFVNQTDFDNKLKDVTSNKNELNELSKKLKRYQSRD